MDFGRLPSLDGVVFKLPPLEARSREVLARGGGAGVVRIGAPAWARKDADRFKNLLARNRAGDYYIDKIRELAAWKKRALAARGR